MKIRVVGFAAFLGVFLVSNVFAQFPDYTSWEQEIYDLDLDDDGQKDLTIKAYGNGNDFVQIWQDNTGKERMLHLMLHWGTKRQIIKSYVKIQSGWLELLSEEEQLKTKANPEALKELESFIKDVGGQENYFNISTKLLEKILKELEERKEK